MKNKTALKLAVATTAYRQTEAFCPLMITGLLPLLVRTSMTTSKAADTVSFLENRETRINPRRIIAHIPQCRYCYDIEPQENAIDLFGYDDFFGHFPAASPHAYVLKK